MRTSVDANNRIIRNGNLEAQYSPDDFVNKDSWSRDGRQGCGKAFIILDAGYVQAIVFGEYYSYCEQDALDEAVDSGKLDGFLLSESELEDYKVGESEDGYPEYEGVINLGNASEPFASESLDIWEVPSSLFEEELCLMTPDRVMERLNERSHYFEEEFNKVEVNNPNWSKAYRDSEDSIDAITLFRLMCLSRK